MTTASEVRRRLLAGEALNAAAIAQEYDTDTSVLAKAVRFLTKDGHRFDRIERPEGGSVWQLSTADDNRTLDSANEPTTASADEPTTASANSGPSTVIRARFLAGETLIASDVARELNCHPAAVNSVRRSMELHGGKFEEEQERLGGRKKVRMIEPPSESSPVGPKPTESKTDIIRSRLLAGEELTPTQVASELGTYNGALKQVVKGLEKKGYLITRTQHGRVSSYRLANGNEARAQARAPRRSMATSALPTMAPPFGAQLTVTMLSLEGSEVVMCLQDGAGRAWMVTLRGSHA